MNPETTLFLTPKTMLHAKTINAFLTGALLLAASATFAQTTTEPAPLVVGVYPIKQEGKICLAVEKQPNTFAFVQLLAPGGEELYRATLPQKGDKFRQVFDLHELKEGTYTLRIKQGKASIVRLIQVVTATPDPTTPARHLTVGN